MPSPFEVVIESASEQHDAIPSPFEDSIGEIDADVEINDRRAASENAEALRLARAL